jgi:hypothetical protein
LSSAIVDALQMRTEDFQLTRTLGLHRLLLRFRLAARKVDQKREPGHTGYDDTKLSFLQQIVNIIPHVSRSLLWLTIAALSKIMAIV